MNSFSVNELIIASVVAFASTFSGVFLAHWVSVRRERTGRMQDDERRLTLVVESILHELRTSSQIVNEYLKSPSAIVMYGELRMISFSTDALDAAVSSGGFALLKAPLQGDLSRTYRSLRRAADDSRRLQDVNSSTASSLTNFADMIANLQMTLNGEVVRLQTLISTSISALEAPRAGR